MLRVHRGAHSVEKLLAHTMKGKLFGKHSSFLLPIPRQKGKKKKALSTVFIKVSLTNSCSLNQPNIWVILLGSIHMLDVLKRKQNLLFKALVESHWCKMGSEKLNH